MINHWLTPALAETGAVANSAEVLEKRIANCRQGRGLVPNILAFDFYVQGDALAVAEKLNGVLGENLYLVPPPSPSPSPRGRGDSNDLTQCLKPGVSYTRRSV